MGSFGRLIADPMAQAHALARSTNQHPKHYLDGIG
jgi:hypothetical protein